VTAGRRTPDDLGARAPGDLESRLSEAVRAGGLRLHYQPVVDLATGRTTGVEALARWHDDVLGEVAPDVFVVAAERSGLIGELGRWVLGEACRQAATWRDEDASGPAAGTGPRVAVNVSPLQLSDRTFVQQVESALAASGLAPERLCLEITETAAVDDVDDTAARLGELRRLGVQLALDDFGTGYSSLTLLRRLPVHLVKIDRTFVEQVARDTRDAVMVRLVIDAAHNLGLRVCAEGVERAEQGQQLMAMGCDSAQGWYFGRPVPPSPELLERLHDGAGSSRLDPAATPSLPLRGSDELVMVTDPEGLITFVSSAVRPLLGLMPAEVVGTRSADHLHPDDLEAVRAMTYGAAETAVTHRVRHRDGSWRWFSTTNHRVQDASGTIVEIMSVSRDVSTAVRAERALAASEARFRHAFDDAPIGMALTSLDGRFLRVNTVFAQLLGTTAEQVLTSTVAALTHPDDREADDANLVALLAGRESVQDVTKRYLDVRGRPVPVRVRAALVTDEHGTATAIAAHVTPRQRAGDPR
jgi:PAS domain S-box-containing protein